MIPVAPFKLPCLAALLLALSLQATEAGAQTVYRCGNRYSQAPCPGGQAVNVDDARTEEQRTAAQNAARRDAERGDSLTQERRRQEAEAAKIGAAGIKPEPKPKAEPKVAAKKPRHKKAARHKLHRQGDEAMSEPMRVPRPPKARNKQD